MKNVTEYDSFNIVKYVYNVLNSMMKDSLDMGTLLSDDPQKLRAYKEQIKKTARTRWEDIAEAFIDLGLADECTCARNDFCKICGGSRYVASAYISSPSFYVENTVWTAGTLGEEEQTQLAEKLLSTQDELS